MTQRKMKIGRNPLAKKRRANVTQLLKRNFEEAPIENSRDSKGLLGRLSDMKISVSVGEVFRHVTEKIK